MYVYESHLGGLYVEEGWWDYDDLYCEQCGDSDRCLGRFDDIRGAIAYLAEDINIYDSGGYGLEYVINTLAGLGTISLDEAKQVVLKNSTLVKCVDCRWFKGHDGNKPICKHWEKCKYDKQPFDFGVPDRCRLMYESKEAGDKIEFDWDYCG